MSDPSEPPPPAPPPDRSGFFGPSNAAGFGGWLGVVLPIGAVAVPSAAVAAWRGPVTPEGVFLFAVYNAVLAGVAVIPGYFAGWVGGRVVRWVQRRRAVNWAPWRAEFAAGVAAGTLLVAGLAVALAVLNA